LILDLLLNRTSESKNRCLGFWILCKIGNILQCWRGATSTETYAGIAFQTNLSTMSNFSRG